MNKLKIALLSFHFAEYSLALAGELSQEHEVLLFLHENNARDEIRNFDSVRKTARFRIITIPYMRSGNPLGVLNVGRILIHLKRFSPHVVHVQETLRDYEFLTLIFLSRLPLVLTIHDHISHTGARENLVKTSIYRRYVRRVSDGVIVHGKSIAQESEIMLPHLAGRIYCIPIGILGDNIEFSADWEQGNVLFFGRIEAYKGLNYFLQAVVRLNDEGLPVKGVIAGKGRIAPREMELIDRSSCFEILNNFIRREKVATLFRAANVVALPYIDATQSGVMALTLNYGRPAVATAVGGLGEVVRNGHNGLLVPARDLNALTEGIGELVINQEKAKRMARNAYEMGRNEFSWKSVAVQTTKVYRRVLQQRCHPMI